MRHLKKSMLPIFAALILISIGACKQNYTPKPKGYFRIALPAEEYQNLQTNCPYTFEYNQVAKWVPKEKCWANIKYPSLRATVQLTYKSVNDTNLNQLIADGHRLAYEHTVKAAGIEENLIYDDSALVYGLLYRLQGDAATTTQFFVTDSTRHFLRGVVYFYAIPNADSLQPVSDFMAQEMLHLVNTLEWQNL
jgi:gliding motility-associated lipoprotein GldD